ncbi:MAG: glycosyltransferase [Gammaproteobacteria bacterium]|nr:glycosyltransferase [Gammaproteobacteria bacterium]
MSLKVLCVTSFFPINQEDKRSQYIWDSLNALSSLKVDSFVLLTKSWQPKSAGLIHSDFIFEEIELTQFPVEIKTCRYLSFPRHYFRAISNFFYMLRVVPEILKLNKVHQFDIIHAHGEIAGLAAMRASKKLNIPAIVTMHGIDTCPRMWKGLSGKMFYHVLNRVNKVIFVGDPLQKYFLPLLINNKNSCVVHNGFRLPIISTERKIFNDSNAAHIISVSNLHKGKGVDLTLLALAKLYERGVKHWTYTIIGSGSERKLCEKIVSRYRLEKNVKFKGDCLHDIVYSELQRSDVFCLPSYREAFGIAYVEAMAHGLLTIAVRGQGPEAFITHNKTGLLVQPRNVDDLAKKLHTAIMNYNEMQSIAIAGQQHVLQNFTWDKHAEKLLSVYKEAISEYKK